MASTVIMAHLSTLMSVLKVKLDGDSPEKHLALKANLICQVVQIWCYCHVEDSRYSFRQQYRPRTLHRQDHVWNDIVNTHCIYNNEEFLSVFRVTRSTFHRVVTLIKDNPVLQGKNVDKQSKHFVPEIHVLATLKYFGAEGNQNSSKRLRENLGMGKGSILNYVERGVKALLSLTDHCVFWPSDEERLEISGRIRQRHSFKNCVGFIDGTHLGLSTRPEYCGEEYFTRKGKYAIAALVIVDDKKRIRQANVGWPGSVHDNRIWSNSTIVRNPHNYFSPKEYLIGDSAFTNSHYLVTSYKRASGQAFLPSGQSWFNDVLNVPRSGVENAIGIWKGRFPWLRDIRMRVRHRKSMIKIIKFIYATIILHNLCVRTPLQTDWITDDGECDSDSEQGHTEEDGFNVSLTAENENCSRRTSIHNYLYRKLLG